MSLLCVVTYALAYLLGVLSTVAVYRYRKRRNRPMPFTARPGESRISAYIRRHGVVFIVVAVLVDVFVTCAVSALFVIQHNQGNEIQTIQTCQTGYISGVAHLSQAKDDALQHVLDDVATKPFDVKRFAHDLVAEQKAYQALADYRATHAPKELCQ